MAKNRTSARLSLGKRLREVRERAGFTQAQVADALGATTQGYTHVRQAVPRRDIEAFRKAFGHGA